jgi:hypothetical protein
MSIVKHQVGDNILVIENEKRLNKYKFSLQYNADTYENILMGDDINCLCPIFNMFPLMCWKVLQTKPTIQQMFNGNNMSATWKVPIFGEEDQNQAIELVLVLDRGDDSSIVNKQLTRAIMKLEQNNNAVNRRIDELVAENAWLRESLELKQNNDNFLTKIIHQNYIIDNLEEVFTFMDEEQKQQAFGLFDFNDRDSKITQKLYDRLMPLDMGYKQDYHKQFRLHSEICKYLIKYIDPNYPIDISEDLYLSGGIWRGQEKKNIDTFFLKLVYHLQRFVESDGMYAGKICVPRKMIEEKRLPGHSSAIHVINVANCEVFYKSHLVFFNIMGHFADKVRTNILPHLHSVHTREYTGYVQLLYPAAITHYMKEQVVNPKDAKLYETAIKVLRILCQAQYI